MAFSTARQLLFSNIEGERYIPPDLFDLVLEDNPEVYWALYPEVSGEENPDYSGNGWTATQNNATYIPTPIRGGKAANCYFLEVNDDINKPFSPYPTMKDVTSWSIEIVVKVEETATIRNEYGLIYGEGTGSSLACAFSFNDIGGARRWALRAFAGGSYYNLTHFADDFEPVHLVGVRDGSSLKFYFNGELVASRNDLPANDDASTLPDRGPSINARALQTDYSTEFFACDAVMYKHALSQSRVQAHFQGAQLLRSN